MTNSAYKLAKQEIGTWEWEVGHNPVVLKYFDDVGHSWVNDDETPWCAAFIGSMLFRAGIRATNKLNARSYLDWGMPCAVEEAEEGDQGGHLGGEACGGSCHHHPASNGPHRPSS